jgi:predicted amidohydrolase YtcJ
MIVLDQDILSIDPAQILDIEVEQTWLGGALVYARDF